MTVSRLFRSVAAAAVVAGALAMPAGAATLIGDSITATYFFPTASNVYGNFSVSPSSTFTVGAGVEATGTVDGSIVQTFDFSATSLTLTLNSSVGWSSAAFNGWQFVNNSKAFDAITSVTGLDPARVAVTGNTLSVNWQGVSFTPGNEVVVNFGPGGAVPEPASWMLLIGGFGMVGGAMRRRRVASIA